MPIQSSQRPCAHGAQPAMQGGKMWSVLAQPRHGPPQTARGGALIRVYGADRLDQRPCITLAWSDLHGQHAPPPLADGAATLRHRRLPVLHAAMPRPTRSSRHPSAGINQRANGATRRTNNLLADRFAFDSRGLQGIIRNGDGNWDNTLSGSPRGTGARTPVPHFFQKAETLSLQPAPRKQLVHNRALMSMRFSIHSSGTSEPVRRVLPVSLRCHCQSALHATR